MSTTASIAAKGCTNTGITEELAQTLHNNLGKTIVAVIELTADARSENQAGDEKVKLSIGTIEVAPDGMAAEHVRELARSFHYERRLTEDGPTLDADEPLEPKVADVIAAGQAHRPHPFLPFNAADDNGICDVCGSLANAAVHHERARILDPFNHDDEDDSDDDQDDDEQDDDEQDEPDPQPA